jgi:hypothetical protein
MVFISKNSLSLLPEDIFCCSVKDHHVSVLKATSNFVNEKTGGMPMALMDLIQSLIPYPCYLIDGQQREITPNTGGKRTRVDGKCYPK